MNTTRRDFVGRSAAAYGALAIGLPDRALEMVPARTARPTQAPLRILFIGGTGFIGPHMVETAIAAGHTPTCSPM
jgi:2'-hydroxyisoflavone reductase